jgi:four helix bundle protein
MFEVSDLVRVKKFDIADRLIDFAVVVIRTSEQLPTTFAGNHLAGQLTRSGTAPALHYGEAQSAEFRPDVIHKMKLAAKELRETYHCLKIISKTNWLKNEVLDQMLSECNELISIFVKSIATAQMNR